MLDEVEQIPGLPDPLCILVMGSENIMCLYIGSENMSTADSEIPRTVMFLVGPAQFQGISRKQGNV